MPLGILLLHYMQYARDQGASLQSSSKTNCSSIH
jgi:hypothetical protein